ncbi:MAG: PilZ domain-containing protein [Gammaproteobacteria bacterium]
MRDESSTDYGQGVTYRGALREPRAARVTLSIDGACYAASDVSELSARGARLEYALVDAPLLQGGEDVVALVQAATDDRPLELAATVLFVSGDGVRMTLALRFDPLSGDAADTIGHASDRRETPRVATAPAAQLARLALGNGNAVDIQVLNHSPAGIGFVVDAATATLLHERDVLTLDLGGAAAPRAVVAHVRHRARRDDHVYFGCRFANFA